MRARPVLWLTPVPVSNGSSDKRPANEPMGGPPQKRKRRSRAAAARALKMTPDFVTKQVGNLDPEGALQDLSDLSEDE